MEFHWSRDNIIYIRPLDGRPDYADLPKNLAVDFGQMLSLPPFAVEEIYRQGIRHQFTTTWGEAVGGIMPEPGLDIVMAEYPRLIAAQAAREKAAQPAPVAPAPDVLAQLVVALAQKAGVAIPPEVLASANPVATAPVANIDKSA